MASISTNSKTHTQKHCRSCWRQDIHLPVPISPIIVGFLTVASFGLFLLFRPTHCVCCGTKRFF
jgi:hypothetical protein